MGFSTDWLEVRRGIDEKRNVKPKTADTYTRNIKKLKRELTGSEEIDLKNPVKWIHNTDKLFDYLDKFRPATIRNNLAALIVMLETYGKGKKDDDLLLELKDYFNEFKKIIEEDYKNGVKTDRQEKNWVETSVLKKELRKMKKELTEREVFEKARITKSDLNLLQQWVIMNLYIGDTENHPPARLENYSEMKIIDKDKYDDLNNTQKESFNWLVVKDRKNKSFIFNIYKTADKYGSIEIKLSPYMNSIINIWLKYNKGDYLLFNYRTGEKLSSNHLGRLITQAFKDTGKNITINLIRSMFLTEKYGSKNEEREEEALKMGHSTNTQDNFYIKKDEDDDVPSSNNE